MVNAAQWESCFNPMNVKFWQRPKPRIGIRVEQRERQLLRLEEFQSDERQVNAFQKFTQHDYFKLMMDVLENEHPAKVVQSENMPLDSRIVLQARGEGYTLALGNIRAMSRAIVARKDLIADFDQQNDYSQ